ncbi:MAG: hypothetical protein ACJ8MH_18075, partial [Povalibacter sp.]
IGIIVVALRHALEERLVTAPRKIAQNAAAGLLRSFGISPVQAAQLATTASTSIFSGATHPRGNP